MIIPGPKVAMPNRPLEAILETLFHEVRNIHTHTDAPYPVKLKFSAVLPVSLKNAESIEYTFLKYGFKITNITQKENETIIDFE